MSRAASLPGADFFLKCDLFLEEATCPGQLRCLGQIFLHKCNFFGKSHLSRAASLPGAELLPEIRFFGRSHLSWAASLPGAELFTACSFFRERTTYPGQLRCLGQIFLQNFDFFLEEVTCPGQLRCLGQNFFLYQKSDFFEQATFRAALLPGAELFLNNPTFFEPAACPGQLRCLGQILFSEILPFLNKPLVLGSFAACGRTFS